MEVKESINEMMDMYCGNCNYRSGYICKNHGDNKCSLSILVKCANKEIPQVADHSGHFYLDEYGYTRCNVVDKVIRYPSVSFGDLDYCPRCGRKLVMP